MLYFSIIRQRHWGPWHGGRAHLFHHQARRGGKKNAIGQIIARFEAAGLKIVAARMMHLSRAQAEGFYAVHRERPFFKDLVDFMISGPVLVQVLRGRETRSRRTAS